MAVKIQVVNDLKKAISTIELEDRRRRIRAANYLKDKIKKKAQDIKITGNLAKGAYTEHHGGASYVGIRSPGYQNYLLEFGHRAGNTQVPPHPIVYPTFQEEADAVGQIMTGV